MTLTSGIGLIFILILGDKPHLVGGCFSLHIEYNNTLHAFFQQLFLEAAHFNPPLIKNAKSHIPHKFHHGNNRLMVATIVFTLSARISPLVPQKVLKSVQKTCLTDAAIIRVIIVKTVHAAITNRCAFFSSSNAVLVSLITKYC